jgi:hypothetical protein
MIVSSAAILKIAFKHEHLGPPSIGQEAEVTDAHEALGQPMQEEAA